MKIALITPLAFPPMSGGCEIHAQKLFENFVKEGDEVTIFTSNAKRYHQLAQKDFVSEELPSEEMHKGVKIVRIPLSKRGKKAVNFLRKYLKHSFRGLYYHFSCGPIFSKSIFTQVKQTNPDLIVSMNIMGTHNFYAIFLSKILKVPYIFIPLIHLEEEHPYFPISKCVLRAADMIITNTHYEKKVVIRKILKSVDKRIIVGGVGPSISHVSSFPPQEKQERKPLVGYVGRLDKGKGCELLLDAMIAVWLEVPDAQLILAGLETSHTKKIEEKIHSLPWNLQENVSLEKNISEERKQGLLKKINVFAMVSEFESFGISYLDAWSMGCAVIALKRGPQSEVLSNGEGGILVDNQTPSELSMAILKLLKSKRVRVQLTFQGQEKIDSHYNWVSISKKLRKHFVKIHNKKESFL